MTPPSLTVSATIAFALLLLGAASFLIRFRARRLFRGYEDISKSLRRIAQGLIHGKIARDKDDIFITGQLESVPFSIRFSHSESAPGMYIRCAAEMDFSLTFAAKTPEDSEKGDVCRVGNSVFDKRFTGRTDNRIRTRQFFAQPNCVDHLQRLCCSNKTMLRFDAGSIELSEALIPSDTVRHVCLHLGSLVLLTRQLSGMRGGPVGSRPTIVPVRNRQWLVKSACVAAVTLAVAGWFMLKEASTNVDAASHDSVPEGTLPADRALVSNSNGWQQARIVDLDPDFVSWLETAGAMPEPQISLDPHGDGSSSLAYMLQAEHDAKLKRVIWIVDRQVVFNSIGRIDGIARIPRDSMSRISWAEGSAPVSGADGDGLLVVRDHTKPDSATVYFAAQHEIHTAIPADLKQISLR